MIVARFRPVNVYTFDCFSSSGFKVRHHPFPPIQDNKTKADSVARPPEWFIQVNAQKASGNLVFFSVVQIEDLDIALHRSFEQITPKFQFFGMHVINDRFTGGVLNDDFQHTKR